MFSRARVRLTLLYISLFTVVIGLFSAVFYVGFATVLAPTFDLSAELTNEQVAEAAYRTTVERIGVALVAADLVMIGVVGVAAWILAARTLRPIREAHARQRRFVADASHEMRTPLAAIRASAESALLADASAADLRRALATVSGSAERLTGITNDLLLLARSDEVPHGPIEAIDLSVTVAETVEAFRAAHPAVPSADLELAADIRVAADRSEIERIVGNLLDNAYRYGPPGRSPRVTTGSTEREVYVEVRDTGPGIAAADVDRIFEPFYRVSSHAGDPAGTGLGLAIAASLARRNRGAIVVFSQPGAGATFRLSLPRFT
ncbi:MAG: HAMP domain-containing sensor histidine kinase [Chloroflexota bacterium]